MNMRKWFRKPAVGALLAVPLLLSGCGLFSSPSSRPIDPPPPDIEMRMMAESELQLPAVQGTVQEKKQDVRADPNASPLTVYLRNEHGLLAPITISMPKTENAAKTSLEMLIDGGANKDKIPSGFQPVLPKGTEVKQVTLQQDKKRAVVELSGKFADYSPRDERKIVEAITWTLTGISGIQQVELWHDGKKMIEMPIDQFPLDKPLTRAIGINLEKADDVVSYSQTVPVTLYFSAITADHFQYYVPVTRLVNPTDDLAATALEQLITGPIRSEALASVLTSGTTVKHIEHDKEKSVITVDLEDSIFEKGDKMPSEFLQAIVLTLTENNHVKQVKINMNGESDIVGTDDIHYGKPVSRPEHINAVKS